MSGWILLHEVLHEFSEVLGSFDGHGVVHRDSDARVESVPSDLNNSGFFCLGHEGFFQLFVSVLDSEDHVDAGSVRIVSDL